MTLPALLALFATSAIELARTPQEAGDSHGLCGSTEALRLGREDLATICVGFHSPQDVSGIAGTKALFQVRVDHYATLSMDSLRAMMGAPWKNKEKYSQVWLGTQGQRTVGQQRGAKHGNSCNATAPGEAAPEGVCYGWAYHDKPLINMHNQLAVGLTALIHLDMGKVDRIQWDNGCNLCPTTEAAGLSRLSCMADMSNISCSKGRSCYDCYAKLKHCSASDAVCAPKIYVAWLGTDVHGQPLLSAGSVLSRFAADSVIGVAKGVVDQINKTVETLAPGGYYSPPPAPPPGVGNPGVVVGNGTNSST